MNDEKVMQRLDKQDAILEQLINMVAKNNEAIQGIRTDMADMKTDMASMKTDMADMKSDISTLKADMTEVKTNLKEVDEKVTHLQQADEERGYQVEVLNKRLFKTEAAVERSS